MAAPLIRIPIQVGFLRDDSEKMDSSTTFTIERELIANLQLKLAKKSKNSKPLAAKVWYNKRKNIYNLFEFETLEEFKQKLAPCLERRLLQELLKDGSLSKRYVTL